MLFRSQRGARYLYTNDTTLVRDPRLQPYVSQSIKKVGDFQVLALRPATVAAPDSTAR